MITIKKFVVNPIDENSFVISDSTGECIFIDPGFYRDEELDEAREYITQNGLTPVKIVATHCHFDHIMGVESIRGEFGIPFQAHKDDLSGLERAVEQTNRYGFKMNPVKHVDSFLEDGGKVSFGSTELKIIHIPGHSPGHVVFYNEQDGCIFTGDALFAGSIGRADLPGGDFDTLISAIKNRLFTLPASTVVYPGHGPYTEIGKEIATNPWFK